MQMAYYNKRNKLYATQFLKCNRMQCFLLWEEEENSRAMDYFEESAVGAKTSTVV